LENSPLVVLALAKTRPVNQNVIVELFEPSLHYEITKRMKEEKQNKTINNQSYFEEVFIGGTLDVNSL
jgi:hypothetical protein